MIWFIVGFIVVGAVYTWYSNSQDYKKQKEKRSLMIDNQNEIIFHLRENNLENCKRYISRDYSCGIVYDEEKDELMFISKKHTRKDGVYVYNYNTINASQLISAELIIDNQTILNTSRTSQIGGALVGGMVAGGIGAIVGGLSGSKIKNENVNRVDMRIRVEDIDNPLIKINFLSPTNFETGQVMKNGYKRDSSEVRTAFNHAERWQGIMETLIRQQNKVVNS